MGGDTIYVKEMKAIVKCEGGAWSFKSICFLYSARPCRDPLVGVYGQSKNKRADQSDQMSAYVRF